MKIIFFGSENNLDVSNIGGIESTIRELSNYLVKAGNEVDLYIMSTRKSLEKRIELRNGFVNLFYLSKHDARKAILNSQYDIINFVQTPFENIIFTFRFLLKKTFENLITTKFFFTFPPTGNNKFLNTLKSYLFFNYNYVFSNRLYNEVKKTSKKVIKLLPPVSTQFYNATKEDKINDKVKILFIGRLSKEKGLDIVLDVFKHINKEKYLTALFGYFKTDEAKQHYFDKINNTDIDEIRITSETKSESESSIPPLWKYDILFLPYKSLHSTLDTPLLILEGLVSNCKIITTDAGFDCVENPNLYKLERNKDIKEVLKQIDFVQAQDWVEFNKGSYSAEFLGSSYLTSLTKEFKNAG